MQHSLSLPSSTIPIPRHTVLFYLGNMPSNSFPPSDLPLIVLMSSSHEVAAIPLKPSSGIVRMNPTLLSPNRQGLTGIDSEEIQTGPMFFRAQPSLPEPVRRIFPRTVGHVFSTEHPKLQHLRRGQFWLEARIEIAAHAFRYFIPIVCLHVVIDNDRFHQSFIGRSGEREALLYSTLQENGFFPTTSCHETEYRPRAGRRRWAQGSIVVLKMGAIARRARNEELPAFVSIN